MAVVGSDAHLRDAPGAPVVALAGGLADTVLAGFEDGEVILWDPASGPRLDGWHLHGPARHLVVDGDHLTVATDIGDVQELDLSQLDLDHCDLLDEVWDRVAPAPGPRGLERAAAGSTGSLLGQGRACYRPAAATPARRP